MWYEPRITTYSERKDGKLDILVTAELVNRNQNCRCLEKVQMTPRILKLCVKLLMAQNMLANEPVNMKAWWVCGRSSLEEILQIGHVCLQDAPHRWLCVWYVVTPYWWDLGQNLCENLAGQMNPGFAKMKWCSLCLHVCQLSWVVDNHNADYNQRSCSSGLL